MGFRPTLCAAAALAVLAACLGRDAKVPAPAGTYFLVGCAGPRTLEWREPWDGALVREIGTGEEPVAIVIAPRSSLAAVASRGDDTVSVYDLAKRTPPRVVALPAGAAPSDVVAHLSYAALVACPGLDAVLEVQLRSRRVSQRFETGAPSPQALVLTDDRSTLYVGHLGGELGAVDLGSGRARPIAALPGPLAGLALSPDGARLWVACGGGLFAVEVQSGELALVEGSGAPLAGVAVDPAGELVLALTGDPALLVVSARDLSVQGRVDLAEQAGGGPASALALDPRGEFALVALPQADRVVAIDVVRRRLRGSYQVGGAPSSLAWIREPRPDPFLGDRARGR